MTDEVKKVTIQVRAPKGTFPGEVAIGYYCVADQCVVLCDETGKPINSEKHLLAPGQDAHLVACRLVRRRPSGGPSNNQILYPRMGRI